MSKQPQAQGIELRRVALPVLERVMSLWCSLFGSQRAAAHPAPGPYSPQSHIPMAACWSAGRPETEARDTALTEPGFTCATTRFSDAGADGGRRF